MKPAYVVLSVLQAFKEKKLILWLLILIFSAAGPLITNYVFSRGIYAIETHQKLKDVIVVFLLFALINSVEVFTKVAAKTRIYFYTHSILIKLQQNFIGNVKIRSKIRKPTVQAARNLTRALQTFSDYFVNTGIYGLVSFFFVPIILFFIDKRVFYVEIAMIIVYFFVTFIFSIKYEKRFEKYDEDRENYFIKISSSNKVAGKGKSMIRSFHKLQNIKFFEWVSVQNIVVIFQFIITAIVVIDIVNGFKGISDLVLIIGYTKESQRFLNSITGNINRLMEIKAGIERLVITSHGAKEGSVLKLT